MKIIHNDEAAEWIIDAALLCLVGIICGAAVGVWVEFFRWV